MVHTNNVIKSAADQVSLDDSTSPEELLTHKLSDKESEIDEEMLRTLINSSDSNHLLGLCRLK